LYVNIGIQVLVDVLAAVREGSWLVFIDHLGHWHEEFVTRFLGKVKGPEIVGQGQGS
jgi:hypothetical protein